MKYWESILLVVACTTFFLLSYRASPQKSAAFDEQFHLTAGYTYAQTGDARLANNHPPLMGLIASLPLLTQDNIHLPLEHPSWEAGNRFLFSDQFFWYAGNQTQAMLESARIPIILVGVLLLLTIFSWARLAFNSRWASWVALSLAVFDPNLLANSRLVTSDLGVTTFLFLSLFFLWLTLKQGNRQTQPERVSTALFLRPLPISLFMAGICAGLALAAKYNGVLIAPLALALILVYPRWHWPRLAYLVGVGLIASLTLWAIFLFEVGPVPFLGGLSLPAPFYWQSLYETVVKLPAEATAKTNFLLGQVSTGGWWYYFPVALAVKTPLPTLILLVWGLIHLGRSGRLRQQVFLWLPALAFLLLGMTGILTIGYRHLLPAMPFVFVLAGSAADSIHLSPPPLKLHNWKGIIIPLLLVWLTVQTLRFFPHHEAYFNELGGDWTHWSEILVDSNLDWGQDLIALQQWQTAYGVPQVNLAYFGMAHPEQYGVGYRPLPSYLRFTTGSEIAAFNPYTPAPGWYAISATSLRLGILSPETAALYAYFASREPDGRAGYSIYLYEVIDERPSRTTVVHDVPVFLETAAALGIEPQTRTITKWVTNGAEIIPQGDEPQTATYKPLHVNFADQMTLLGIELPSAEINAPAVLELTLYWRVDTQQLPTPYPAQAPPLSAFVHLTGEEAWQVFAQYDGWPTAIRGLEPNDLIIQPVQLWVGEQVPPRTYHLRAGLYRPATGERLQTEGADAVPLGMIMVTAEEQ